MLDKGLLDLSTEIEQSFKDAVLGTHSAANRAALRSAFYRRALAGQLFSHFRAVGLLVRNEHDEEAQILLRSMTDLVIRLGYLNRFPEHWIAMVMQDYKKSRHAVNQLALLRAEKSNGQISVQDQTTLAAIDQSISSLEAEEGEQPGLGNLLSLARKADQAVGPDANGYQLLHRTYFYFFSDNVHAGPRALERYLQLDADGAPCGLILNPHPQKANFALYHGCSLFLTGWSILVEDASAEEQEKVTPLRNRLEHSAHFATSSSP